MENFGTLIWIIILLLIFGKPLINMLLSHVYQKNLILVMSIEGVLAYDSNDSSRFGLLKKGFNKIEKLGPKVLILRVNSPGGTVGASQEIYGALKKIKSKGTRIIALMEDVAASGGLYISLPADHIIALPGTITGSIGVILQNYEYSALLEKYKIKVQTIKSGKHKDIFSSKRKMTSEEKKILQDMIMDVYDQFVTAVSEERRIPVDKVKKFADGRVLSGGQAKALGLVDSVGSFAEAVDVAVKLAKIEKGKERIHYLKLKPSIIGGMFGRFFPPSLDFFSDLKARTQGIPLWLMPKF